MTRRLATVANCNDDIPMPIVRLNRWTLLLGVTAGLLTQQPWITTVLFLLILPAVLWGQKRSPIFQVGSRLFARQNATAPREDRRLMRFNNSIALTLLSCAQVAFLLNAPLAGWTFAGMVATAAAVALAGFCLGCYIYYKFKIHRTRLFRRFAGSQ
jgi:hypothetical protein